MSGLLAMLTFLIVSVPIVDIAKVPFGEILANLGGQGLFVALIVGILATEAMAYLLKRGLTFQMPPGVPPGGSGPGRAYSGEATGHPLQEGAVTGGNGSSGWSKAAAVPAQASRRARRRSVLSIRHLLRRGA